MGCFRVGRWALNSISPSPPALASTVPASSAKHRSRYAGSIAATGLHRRRPLVMNLVSTLFRPGRKLRPSPLRCGPAPHRSIRHAGDPGQRCLPIRTVKGFADLPKQNSVHVQFLRVLALNGHGNWASCPVSGKNNSPADRRYVGSATAVCNPSRKNDYRRSSG